MLAREEIARETLASKDLARGGRTAAPNRRFKRILNMSLAAGLLSIPAPCLTSGLAKGPEADVRMLVSKDITDIPGKEGVMLTVVYPPGSADPVHTHRAH